MVRQPTLKGRVREATQTRRPRMRAAPARPRERWRPGNCRALLAIMLALALGVVFAGCGDEQSTDTPLTVFAAASLTDAFTELGEEFAAAHPDAAPRFSFAGSGDLATQIKEGAPADVFASADLVAMQSAGDAVDASRIFARNRMMIVVAPGNPHAVKGLADLGGENLNVVLAAADVPAGRYAAEILERAHVAVTPVSLETNVKGVVSKVALGEADAGIVYVTDVTAAGDAASGVAIPDAQNAIAEYPIARVAAAERADDAAAFVDFVLSPAGQAILARYGFAAGGT